MRLSTLCPVAAFASVGLSAAVGRDISPRPRDMNVPLNLLAKRAACGEGPELVCYGVMGGTSQNLDPDDIEYAAAYLRYLADNDGGNPLWTMPSEFTCSEWTLPLFGAGSVLALAKHINPRTQSSVTYYDLARTFDGGEDATEEQRAASLLGACGTNGGQLAVTVNLDDPVYQTPEYIASKAKPADIIIKLVRDPNAN